MSEASKSVWVDGKCIKSVKEYTGLLSASDKPAACENGGPWTKWWDLDRRDWPGRCYRQFDEVPSDAKLTLRYPTWMIRSRLGEQDRPQTAALAHAVDTGIFLGGFGILCWGISAFASVLLPQPHTQERS
ncbi:unnamed protein product [Vitrella brassicaformis CCMP3155]|uniref:Uncharacterized protein n=1 Tax=Vitrella brassicaformis (strain CCMP3155) TaxID=1169540 RepID=A0A0G4F224_VITBC|nr:unnamed protein product [Vitrella brassicaformis CCMP3155]|eukprot:CEM05968.1 unnamed protein product [Vitrella brassicaformis CCMP3155]